MSQLQQGAGHIPQVSKTLVGDWEVNQSEGTLRANGKCVRLEPRVMDVFIYLVAHSQRVVAKEELIAAVWGGAFVEDGVLSQAVHSLRKVLGDDARQPRYIQTIPKRGYRLLAEVVHEESPTAELARKALPLPQATRGLRAHGRGLLLTLLIGVCLAVVTVTWLSRGKLREGQHGTRKAAQVIAGKRIVVLPFQNLGKPEDAYFADGLTEEITKDLASLSSLQVISRTSAMQYQGARKSLPEIGRELGVDYVLEGTVRWAKGPGGQPRVRITPQLIQVAGDDHIWADAFERTVKDIFEVQEEISRQVVGHLGIALLPAEQQRLRPPPTDNLEAYQAYLRGLEFKNQPYYSEEYLRKAVSMFERAVKLDPAFATAWAELSQVHSYLAYNSDPSAAQVERARKATETAVALAPQLPVVRLAQAYFTYRCLEDFDAAHEQIQAAAQSAPNDAEILQALGLILRRKGRLLEAIDAFQHAYSLDPRTIKLLWSVAETYHALREYEEADRYFARIVSLAPDQPVYWEQRAINRLAWTGDLEQARAVVGEAPIPSLSGLVPVTFELSLYSRDYGKALALLSPPKVQELAPQSQSRIKTLAVIARQLSGDRQGALIGAEANRVELEARAARFPREPFYRAYLAVALAQLGRKAEALTEVEQAVEQRRHDAFTGPRVVEIQALVDVILGRRREAVDRLEHLCSIAYQSPISAAELRLSPVWEQLRTTPGFVELLRHCGP